MIFSLIHLYRINMKRQQQTITQKLDRVKILKLKFELKLKKLFCNMIFSLIHLYKINMKSQQQTITQKLDRV